MERNGGCAMVASSALMELDLEPCAARMLHRPLSMAERTEMERYDEVREIRATRPSLCSLCKRDRLWRGGLLGCSRGDVARTSVEYPGDRPATFPGP